MLPDPPLLLPPDAPAGHHHIANEELQALKSQVAALQATVSKQAEEMATLSSALVGLKKQLEDREPPHLKPSETEEPGNGTGELMYVRRWRRRKQFASSQPNGTAEERDRRRTSGRCAAFETIMTSR